jgi:hypothetical protein
MKAPNNLQAKNSPIQSIHSFLQLTSTHFSVKAYNVQNAPAVEQDMFSNPFFHLRALR